MTNLSVQEKEFVVNEHLTLKLEEGKTVLYVDGERFRQCMQLVLKIPIRDFSEYESIQTIDEAAELNKNLYQNRIRGKEELEAERSIMPEQEFWGHCSNIQAWTENNYDTRLIHSNLAFPLLRRLMEAGDQKALFSLKEEIAHAFEYWFESSFSKIADELIINDYLSYLTKEERGIHL